MLKTKASQKEFLPSCACVGVSTGESNTRSGTYKTNALWATHSCMAMSACTPSDFKGLPPPFKPSLVFRDRVSHWTVLSVGQTEHQTSGVSCFSVLSYCVLPGLPFHADAGDLNMGLRACMTNTLPPEPSCQPLQGSGNSRYPPGEDCPDNPHTDWVQSLGIWRESRAEPGSLEFLSCQPLQNNPDRNRSTLS